MIVSFVKSLYLASLPDWAAFSVNYLEILYPKELLDVIKPLSTLITS